MFSSLPLGYNHKIFDENYYGEVKKIAHIKMCNNLFETDEMLEFDNIFQQSLLFLIDITVPQGHLQLKAQ